MVNIARRVRRRWRRMATLSTERGETPSQIDLESFLDVVAESGRQSLTTIADCHHQVQLVRVERTRR